MVIQVSKYAPIIAARERADMGPLKELSRLQIIRIKKQERIQSIDKPNSIFHSKQPLCS